MFLDKITLMHIFITYSEANWYIVALISAIDTI